MSDTCRAGCDCKDVIALGYAGCCSSFLSFFVSKLLALCLVDDGKELVYGLSASQRICEIIIHEQHGKTGKNFQMNVLFCIRSCNKENDVGRLSVRCLVVNTFRKCHSCKTRSLDSVCLCVRDSDAIADTCCALFFTCNDGSFILLFVRDVALFVHEVYHLVDGIHLACCASAELNAFRFQQISNSHTQSSSYALGGFLSGDCVSR